MFSKYFEYLGSFPTKMDKQPLHVDFKEALV